MTSIPAKPAGTDPAPQGQQPPRHDTSGGARDLGQQPRHAKSGSQDANQSAVARFGAQLDIASARATPVKGPTAQQRDKDNDTPDQMPPQLLIALQPNIVAEPKTVSLGSTTAEQVQALSTRVETEIRAAESLMIGRGAKGEFNVRFDLGRNALGMTGVELSFGPKELSITVTAPIGSAAHNLADAMSVLAQSLAARYPNRLIRVLRQDGSETAAAAPSEFDPLNPLRGQR